MKPAIRRSALWLLGLLGLAFVIAYFDPADFLEQLRTVGLGGVIGWLVLTLVARAVMAEITVLLVRVLGFSLRRADAFWINWIRTFANQVMPLSGVAVFAYEVRRKLGIPWPALAALSTPLIFLSSTALGVLGCLAVVSNLAHMDTAAIPMLAAFSVLLCLSLLAVSRAEWLIGKLPRKLSSQAHGMATSLRKLSAGHVIGKVILLNAVAIVFRGSRLWLLFRVIGIDIDWTGALLLIVVSESTMLFQITPGGLGLREGAIVGVAALLGIQTEVGAAVALIDRLFVVGTTTFMAVPAYFHLRSQSNRTSVSH